MGLTLEQTKRKPNRLYRYDYSTPGAYFITVCTKNKEKILSTVGATIGRPRLQLTEYGKMIDKAIKTIEKVYPFVTVDQYVIMPNHIHLLLQIHTDENGRPNTQARSPLQINTQIVGARIARPKQTPTAAQCGFYLS